MPRERGEPLPYQVQLDDEHWEELRTWDERPLDVLLTFLRDHASQTPTTLIPGKLKRLRGARSGYYQFSVDRRRRLIYIVDEKQKLVLVEYVGPHPDWRKSRRRRITR